MRGILFLTFNIYVYFCISRNYYLLNMLQTTEGVVLRAVKYKETILLVDAFTEDFGRVTFQVTLPRSRKAVLRASLFQPLTLVEWVADVRPTSSVCKVTEAKLVSPFASIPFDPFKSAIVLFLSEFLYRAIRDESVNSALFAYIKYSLCWLDACESGFANFHLVFLMRFSRFLGLYPNLDDYAPGAYFDLLNGCFTSLCPLHHAFYLGQEESSRLLTLMRMNYDTMHLFEMSRQERTRCLMVLNEYYRLHLPNFPVLKSLEVLKELFD